MSATHKTVKTPSPRERSLVVLVEEEVFAGNSNILPPEGTPYKSFPPGIRSGDYLKAYGEYIYVGQTGDRGLLFAKNKSKQEANTPFRKQWSKFGNHRWHPILKNLVLLENPSFPRSTNIIQNGQQGFAVASSYDDRYIYIPDANEGTRFFTEEFFCGQMFTIPRYRVPIPTGVQYSIGDLRGSFQECLHDDIDIPATRQANAVYLGGAAYSGNGTLQGQFFPRTNVKSWVPYCCYDEQSLTESGWYRKRIRVFPPARPRAITRA